MSTPLHFPNRTQAPPGGWRYRVAATGAVLKGPSEGALVAAIQTHCKANQIDYPPDLWNEIEQQICAEQPSYCTGAAPQLTIPQGARRTIQQIISGTRTLGSWLVSGCQRVSVEQATARAAVCVSCPQNVDPSGCSGCNMKDLKRLINVVVGGSIVTPHDSQLKACQICGCALQAKTRVPLEIIRAHMPKAVQEALPGHCWVKTEGGSRDFEPI